MEDLSLDLARTALVLIDLQNGIVPRQWAPYTGEHVVGNCSQLAQEMRNRGGMVVYVHVLLNDMVSLPADQPGHAPGASAPPPEASQFVPEAGVEATDVVIAKRQWGAFYGTNLDQQLRRRGIRTTVMAGIATNMGVESTARAAFDRAYELVFVEDAMTSFSAEAHQFACQQVFKRMGRVRSTEHVLQALRAAAIKA
jgi:nicotinamidase-related amidase